MPSLWIKYLKEKKGNKNMSDKKRREGKIKFSFFDRKILIGKNMKDFGFPFFLLVFSSK